MEPQDTLTQIGAIAGISAAIWLIVRDAVPLAVRLVVTIREWVKRERLRRIEVRAKREAASQESVRIAEVDDLRKEFLSTASRLRCILHNEDRFHRVELITQQRDCKKAAIRFAASNGTYWSQRYSGKPGQLVRFESGTLLVSFHTNPPIEERFFVVVRCHPNPEFSGSDGDETWGQLETLLAEPVDDQELADVGWEHPKGFIHGWRMDTSPFDDGRFVREYRL